MPFYHVAFLVNRNIDIRVDVTKKGIYNIVNKETKKIFINDVEVTPLRRDIIENLLNPKHFGYGLSVDTKSVTFLNVTDFNLTFKISDKDFTAHNILENMQYLINITETVRMILKEKKELITQSKTFTI